MPANTNGTVELLVRLARSIDLLVRDHIALFKLEISEPTSTVGVRIALLALSVEAILLGYALACAALAIGIGHWITPVGGLLLVGAVNIATGAIVLARTLRRLRGREPSDGQEAAPGPVVALRPLMF